MGIGGKSDGRKRESDGGEAEAESHEDGGTAERSECIGMRRLRSEVERAAA